MTPTSPHGTDCDQSQTDPAQAGSGQDENVYLTPSKSTMERVQLLGLHTSETELRHLMAGFFSDTQQQNDKQYETDARAIYHALLQCPQFADNHQLLPPIEALIHRSSKEANLPYKRPAAPLRVRARIPFGR